MAGCGSYALLLLAGLACIAAQLPTGFTKSSIISGLYNPIDIEYLPDGTMMIVLRHGVIAQLKNGAAVTYLDISQVVDSNGEKGFDVFSISCLPSHHFNTIFHVIALSLLSLFCDEMSYVAGLMDMELDPQFATNGKSETITRNNCSSHLL
jgi:hypothetical protein